MRWFSWRPDKHLDAADCLQEIGKMRDDRAIVRGIGGSGGSCSARLRTERGQRGEQIRSTDARDYRSGGSEKNLEIPAENKQSGNSDAAFFLPVIEIPFAHNLVFHIAKDRERNRIAAAHFFAAGGRVHRQRDQIRARDPEFLRVFAELRQLAETERSPVSAIKNQDERAVGE
jgi:hypothetical protein